MTIITNIRSKGATVSSSLSGGLSINESNGEIVIRDGTEEVLRLDKTGFKYYDNNGTTRITIGKNSSGLQQITVFDSTGKAQILVGQNPDGGDPVIAVAKPGYDVLEELQNG